MRQNEISFLHGSNTPRCNAAIDKHFDGYYSLQYIHRGNIEIFYDDRRHVIRAPGIWPCYPGPHIRFHVLKKGQTWNHRYIAFTGKLPCEWMAAGLFMDKPIELNSPDDLPQRLDDIIRFGIHGIGLEKLKATNLLENLLIDISAKTVESPHKKRLDFLIEFLGDAANYPIDYESLADRLDMGVSTMRRWFKSKTGMSMHTYVLQSRMSLARTLLLETSLPIKKIAQKLNFNDVFFFTRQFTKYVGITPAKYRNTNQT